MSSMYRLFFAVMLIVALGSTTSADQVPQLSRVMRAKLDRSQAILAAVITSDWASLDRESRALALVIRDPAWTAPLTNPEYLRQSDAFSRALQELIEASATRDLEAAGNAHLTLMASCIRCHVDVTRRRNARRLWNVIPPVGD
jgi:hypothetical protein